MLWFWPFFWPFFNDYSFFFSFISWFYVKRLLQSEELLNSWQFPKISEIILPSTQVMLILHNVCMLFQTGAVQETRTRLVAALKYYYKKSTASELIVLDKPSLFCCLKQRFVNALFYGREKSKSALCAKPYRAFAYRRCKNRVVQLSFCQAERRRTGFPY